MSKSVVLSLGNGDLDNGFPSVSAQLRESNNVCLENIPGSLPAAPKLREIYKSWRSHYLLLYQRLNLSPRIEIEPEGVTHISERKFKDLCQQLSDEINNWLHCKSFHSVEQELRTQLAPSEEIRVIIETNDTLVRRLPWHLWNFFEAYPKAEVALSVSKYRRPNNQKKTLPKKVRILAIFGHDQGINLEPDRAFLEQLLKLNKAEIKFLNQPEPKDLNDQLWEQGWDILFFAGHSSSQERGEFKLNEKNSLTLYYFRYALKKAIERGLKLAIFNSCDGLGLAWDLGKLQIPQVIVMREPIPDVVAQAFLKHFLAAFSRGKSLYTSVREARERLQTLEDTYFCATWLPVICQNPAVLPITWKELCGEEKNDFLTSKCSLRTVLLASVVVTALVMGVRQLGMLQNWELQAFDQSLRLRPNEAPDSRLLLVTVTEEDIQKQNLKERRSLSDPALAQLLKKLQPYQPQVIGLDIYRDFPVDPKQADLATYLQDERFIAVCDVGGEDDYPGIGPPPGIPENRLSFSDIPFDPDKVVRRQLLGMAKDPKSFCNTDTSFSFRVAQTYLAVKEGIQYKFTPEGNLQIGSVVFKKLEADTGGYQQLNALGYQVLLNYRSSDSVAQQVSLYDILSGSLDAELPDLVKDRIVLIGTTARSFKDYFPTPYSVDRWSGELPGVVIHAHMVSQILSAVLDRRPLLWWFPAWGETLWIWGWSLVGGVLVWYWRSPLHRGLASSAALGTLYGICFVLLLKGGWVPLVPSALTLIATGATVVVCTVSQSRQ